MASLYTQQSKNVRKTWVLISIFFVALFLNPNFVFAKLTENDLEGCKRSSELMYRGHVMLNVCNMAKEIFSSCGYLYAYKDEYEAFTEYLKEEEYTEEDLLYEYIVHYNSADSATKGLKESLDQELFQHPGSPYNITEEFINKRNEHFNNLKTENPLLYKELEDAGFLIKYKLAGELLHKDSEKIISHCEAEASLLKDRIYNDVPALMKPIFKTMTKVTEGVFGTTDIAVLSSPEEAKKIMKQNIENIVKKESPLDENNNIITEKQEERQLDKQPEEQEKESVFIKIKKWFTRTFNSIFK